MIPVCDDRYNILIMIPNQYIVLNINVFQLNCFKNIYKKKRIAKEFIPLYFCTKKYDNVSFLLFVKNNSTKNNNNEKQ